MPTFGELWTIIHAKDGLDRDFSNVEFNEFVAPVNKSITILGHNSRTPRFTMTKDNGQSETFSMGMGNPKWQLDVAEFLGLGPVQNTKVVLKNVVVSLDHYGDITDESFEDIRKQVKRITAKKTKPTPLAKRRRIT